MTVLTQAEAARRLGVSRQRVNQLIRLGRLPQVRTESGTGIPEQAVADRLDSPPLNYRQPTRPGPGFYTVADVAKVTGRSEATIYRWINLGWLPAEQMNGAWVVPAENVYGLNLPRRGRRPLMEATQ
jgi:excisionase family DNA binding protein